MSTAGPAGGGTSAKRGDGPSRADAPAFDVDEALAEIPGGLETARELAELFAGEYAVVSERMRLALADADAEPIRRGAHMLKSSAGIFAAHAAEQAAERLESLAAAGDLAQVGPAMATFEREAARLLAALERHFGPAAEGPA